MYSPFAILTTMLYYTTVCCEVMNCTEQFGDGLLTHALLLMLQVIILLQQYRQASRGLVE